jgi:hypothetical protein
MDQYNDDTDTDVEMDASSSSGTNGADETATELVADRAIDRPARRSCVVNSYKAANNYHPRSSKATLIAEEVIRNHFHLPVIIAAKKLSVCDTVLKQMCREYGIMRWPHLKLKSIQNQIQSLKYKRKSSTGYSKSRVAYRKRLDKRIAELTEQKDTVMNGSCSEGIQLNSMKHRRILNIRKYPSPNVQAAILKHER